MYNKYLYPMKKCLFLVLGFFTLCVPNLLNAAPAPAIADTPCDEQYYKSLSARAWLEAQREITQNQNLILKPDSVFEYTCFDLFLRELADHASNMLSETSSYGSPLSTTSMDTALNRLVVTSLISYINLNFETAGSGNYDLLAGHTAGTGIDHTPSNVASPFTYSCDVMSRVWQAAKCINFVSNSATDGFYTFEEYTTGDDKRHLPAACTAIGSTYTSNISTALTAGPWANDPVQTYFNITAPPTCAGSCTCDGEPIPTGVKVIGNSSTADDEYVCIQPGCTYKKSTNTCVTQ